MNEVCNDNRFDLIAAYKRDLIDGTNIETSPDEMAVIDNILFRFWQMGWLLPTPRTNANRIRAMTDEELAEWTATLPCCPPGPDLEALCYPKNGCKNMHQMRKCWLNWLKQEVQG